MPVAVQWDKAAISAFMKNSKAIGDELMRAGAKVAEMNNKAALKKHHKPLPSGALYVCDHRMLRHTQAAVVHSTNKVAAAIGRKYGYPKKYKV